MYSEVTHISRQKYMAELSKLLAFMFKEDKEDILAHYNKILDEAEDEQTALESFGSPTKLAVTISRTYKRTERKLAVEADSREDAPAAQDAAVSAPTEKTARPKPAVGSDMSYADIIEEIRREKAEAEGKEYTPIFFNEPQAQEVSASNEEMPAPAAEEELPVAEAPSAEEESQPEAESEEADTEQTAEAEEPTQAEPEAQEAEPAPAAEETAEEPECVEVEEQDNETVRFKTNVALLILYLIFAIPIGVVVVAAAIVAALILIIAAMSVIWLGVKAIGFAASSLVIFADVILCVGASLIAFAVALLVLWLGVLLIGGVGGIVRAIVALGRRLCVKEVSGNE